MMTAKFSANLGFGAWRGGLCTYLALVSKHGEHYKKNLELIICTELSIFFLSCSSVPGDAAERAGHMKQALALYKQGTYQGDSSSALRMGFALLDEKVRAQFPEYGNASEWFLKACELKDAEGCHNVGFAYEYGKLGLAKNYENAARYYLKAAKQDFMSSQYNFASMESNNYLKPANKIEGYKWMLVSKAQASKCKEEICLWILKDEPGHQKKLESALNPYELDKAKKLAQTWTAEK